MRSDPGRSTLPHEPGNRVSPVITIDSVVPSPTTRLVPPGLHTNSKSMLLEFCVAPPVSRCGQELDVDIPHLKCCPGLHAQHAASVLHTRPFEDLSPLDSRNIRGKIITINKVAEAWNLLLQAAYVVIVEVCSDIPHDLDPMLRSELDDTLGVPCMTSN